MAHELPQLGYEYDSLEPYIDAKTMEIHHTKHHQSYVDKLNTALEGHEELQNQPIEEVLKKFSSLPDGIKTAVKNHGGGHANHSLFWTILKVVGDNNQPSGELAEEINRKFGSYDKFKEQFTKAATGRFGSGWAWLVVNAEGGLEIIDTPNQDSPLIENLTPILGLDVWEHAYYLKYQNKRPDYIEAFFKIIDWDKVAEYFEKAK